MNNKKEILQLLTTDYYVTAEQLAKRFKISTKTIRMRIKELNQEGTDYGFFIQSKPRHGYILLLQENNRLEEYLQIRKPVKIPETVEDRIYYLLAYLLNYDGYIRLEDLGDFLYVSRPTMQNTVREVESILNQYHLYLDRKPNYGIKVIGNEFHIRRCIMDCFIRHKGFEGQEELIKEEKVCQMAELVLPILKKYDIHLTEISIKNFIDYLYVSVRRIRHKHWIGLRQPKLEESIQKEKMCAEEILELVCQKEEIHCRAEEVSYLAIYIRGKQMMGNMSGDEENFVIQEKIDYLSVKMLERVRQEFQVDFRNNLEIRMMLNQHMVALDIRLRYHIPFQNPMLDEIKNKYILAYTMASHASVVLAENYYTTVSEDEIGYLALIFALALEQNHSINKVNILIVCGSGKGSSRLLKHRYKSEFAEYIDRIYVCDLMELEVFDFSKVAYVFTTVPITSYVPKPIVKIGLFLEDTDKAAVRTMLEKGEKSYLTRYYKREMFFIDLPEKKKEDILQSLCRKMEEREPLPKGFYEAVLKREELAQTDFGNLIAMPHPYRLMTPETRVCVAVLPEPVFWTKYPVQVIFLISVGLNEDPDLGKFYDDTTSLLLRKEAIDDLIQHPSYDVLLELLRQDRCF